MAKAREFNVSILYPLISPENARVIQKYYDEYILTIKSDATYTGYIYAMEKFCSVINKPGVLSFDQWDTDIADAYLSMIDVRYERAALMVKLVKNIVYSSGSRCSLEQLKPAKYCDVYNIPFYTLSDVDLLMRRAYDATHEHINWNTLNDWSTPIIMCYLLWLGFTKPEIAILKKTDYDSRSGVIVLETDGVIKRRAIDEPIIEEYLERYIKGTNYRVYNEYHHEKTIWYSDEDSLIKSVKAPVTLSSLNQYGRKFTEYFGFTPDDVLEAGRMDKLYYLDVIKGLEISVKNIKDIAEYIGVPTPTRAIRNSELGSLIYKYPSYKEQRAITKK